MRELPNNLEEAQGTFPRRPAYKIYAYDGKVNTIGQIVRGEFTQGPLDLTPYCTNISWTPKMFKFTLSDPEKQFHPDTGEYKNYIADKAIIRLKEGDSRVNESEWMWTFTGQIRGQVGWKKIRSSKTLQTQISVFSRENAQSLQRRKITTREYTVGSELGVMLQDICQIFVDIQASELRVPPVLGLQLRHRVNQLVLMTPWESITIILGTVSKIPYFDGEGKLYSLNKNMNRSVDRYLPDYIRIYNYEIPEYNADGINKVKVTFLDAELERVDGPVQKLGEAQVTTGFFSMHEKLECWWSEDHKQRAYNTWMKIIKSVNSGILPVGTERYVEVDVFHGEIHVDIAIWVPILYSVLVLIYLAAAFYTPDKTESNSTNIMPCFGEVVLGAVVMPSGSIMVGEVPGTAWTIPGPGSILQMAAMAGIFAITMSMGSAQYEIWGTPFDYVYLERQSIAIEDGLNYWEENEKEIKNDLIGSYEQADTLAITELIWEKSNTLPRQLLLDDDLAIEIGDILGLPDNRKFIVTDMSKTIKRGEIPILTLTGCKVLTA